MLKQNECGMIIVYYYIVKRSLIVLM